MRYTLPIVMDPLMETCVGFRDLYQLHARSIYYKDALVFNATVRSA